MAWISNRTYLLVIAAAACILTRSLSSSFLLSPSTTATTTVTQQQKQIQQQQQLQLRMLMENNNDNDQQQQQDNNNSFTRNRRQLLLQDFSLTTAAAVLLVAGGSITHQPQPAFAAMENSQKVFEIGKSLTVDQAKSRFKDGQVSLQYLLDHYDEICEGGGDNVRRYLGTVGTTSGLYGISKVMRTLQDEADDIVDYTETMNEVNAALQGADGSAYMAIFTVTSTSGVPPEKYYGDAKIEVKRAIKSMQDIAEQLNIR